MKSRIKLQIEKSEGLTLIEIIAAVGILALGLIAILSLFPTGLKMAQKSTYTVYGTLQAQSFLDEIRFLIDRGNDLSAIENTLVDGSNIYKESTDPTQLRPFPYDDRLEYTLIYNQNIYGISGLHEVVLALYWPPGALRKTQRVFVTRIYCP